jgi:hypothetical protein
MTEMVLLFPIFLFFLFGFVNIFSLLILVQKVEIASVYAATRWQFESHKNVDYDSFDEGALRRDIQERAMEYIGFKNPGLRKNLALDKLQLYVQRTQVWSVLTLRVTTKPWALSSIMTPQEGPMRKTQGFVFESTKYVPSRDRPIRYLLPGSQ